MRGQAARVSVPDPGWCAARRRSQAARRGERSSEAHRKRPRHRREHPVLVTLRVADDLLSLRQDELYRALRWATASQLRRTDVRICHVGVQGNHVHLIVEADDERALAKGMQGFEVSAAKHINRTVGELTGTRRRGSVFPDRYHAVALETPTQVRNALNYLFNNCRRHGADRGSRARLDPYSTANAVSGWADDRRPVMPACRRRRSG